MRVTVLRAVLLALLACPSAWAEQSAKDILRASGIKGGLVVQLGCGDGKLTTALRAGDSFIVQGLDTDPTNVEKARAHFRPLGLGGKVSADAFDGQQLPYVDNLVNLVVAEDLGKVAMAEVMRVLCPGGVAYVKQKGRGARRSSRGRIQSTIGPTTSMTPRARPSPTTGSPDIRRVCNGRADRSGPGATNTRPACKPWFRPAAGSST